MYRLLTADDEPDKLEILRNLYNWPDYHVEICGEAQNGIDAYRQIIAKKPDICIMDIKMPLLSGLEVIKRTRENGSQTKYIILSGYDEFDYAKEAIGLSVIDYLLKPCRPEDIVRSVQKCIDLIEHERTQSELEKDYVHLQEENTDSNRIRQLNALLSGLPIKDLEYTRKSCRLETLGTSFAVCVFDITAAVYAKENQEPIDLTQLCTSMEAALVSEWPCVVLPFRDQITAVMGTDRIAEKFDSFYNALKNALSCCVPCEANFSVGISDCKDSIRLLNTAYLEAKQAAEVSKFLFPRKILFYAELQDEGSPSVLENPEPIFLQNLSDDSEIIKLVDEFLGVRTVCSVDVQEKTKESVVTLVCNIYKLCTQSGFYYKELSKAKSDVIKRILESDSLACIRSVLTTFLLTIGNSVADSTSTSSLVRRTIRYIQQNYSKHISLESAAGTIHVTPPYLSMLFKQQTGLTFVEYVNRFRVNEAEKLLRSEDLKSYEIAFAVGFQDEKYFHNIFKRYTGLTTRQFRDGTYTNTTMKNHSTYTP